MATTDFSVNVILFDKAGDALQTLDRAEFDRLRLSLTDSIEKGVENPHCSGYAVCDIDNTPLYIASWNQDKWSETFLNIGNNKRS